MSVNVPFWLLVLLIVLAALSVLDRLLVPSVRWFFRRRVSRVLEEVSQHLDIKIEPFRLTKREVLIDRLLYDQQVMEAAEAYVRDQDMPREVLMAKVERHAREVVPGFNAYFYFLPNKLPSSPLPISTMSSIEVPSPSLSSKLLNMSTADGEV